jgi:acetyl-CoA synthetase
MSTEKLESISQENRLFQPVTSLAEKAYISSREAYDKLYKESIENPEGFWDKVAKELVWTKPWSRVLNEDKKPFFRWFEGGKTNITLNCLDRHVQEGRGDKIAIYFEGEPGDVRTLTYAQLLREVQIAANGLKKIGIGKGDRVAVYLPMIAELPILVLACARIGAIHSVIFAGFSADSIRDRVLDSECKLVITADGSWRRGKQLNLKEIVDDGVANCECVKNVLVVRRGGLGDYKAPMQAGRDLWFDEVIEGVSDVCPAEEMDAEDTLFLLYTSGTTGKPKGVIHTVGGYMVYTYLTAKYVFDMKPSDVYWCTADVGWITGHSYIVYGPMQNAVTQVIYEGAPNFPENDRFWELIEKYKVTIFYTAPTAIRAFMKWGDQWPEAHDLSSLRLLGSVGEPINPEAWMWYHKVIGKERCPIVDTWWQTETGGIMITPLPGAIATKPGSATVPFFGIDAAVLEEDGTETEAGLLAIRRPWPGIMRGVYGDPERFVNTYWCKWNGKYYFPGDGAHRDKDGYLWILGRVDDVVNVSGHRIGTAELESIFIEHHSVAESAVIGVAHEIKGQGLVAFVTVKEGASADDSLKKELNDLVSRKIGKFALPEKIIFSIDLPKTRSGKIMRRLLRDIAEGRALGNITTLADPSVVDSLKSQYSDD